MKPDRDIGWKIFLWSILAYVILLSALGLAFGHEQYSTWKTKDGVSCCGDRDCYETDAKFSEGFWWALRREDQKWLQVPVHLVLVGAAKDGKAHLCALPPHPSGNDVVYCFMMEAMGG